MEIKQILGSIDKKQLMNILFGVLIILIVLIVCARCCKKEKFDPNSTSISELREESKKQKEEQTKGSFFDNLLDNIEDTIKDAVEDTAQALGGNLDDKNIESNGKDANKLDPISNPRYNMQQVVKQSILLEEHLLNRRKRCRDCITKHFNHIIGLCEEAVMLSTNRPKGYCPHLNTSVELYNNLFKQWLAYRKQNKEHDEVCMTKICDKLRSNRKKLITCYFFEEPTTNTALNYKDTYTKEEKLREHMTLQNPLNIPYGFTTILGSQY